MRSVPCRTRKPANSNKPLMKCTRNWAGCDEGSGGGAFIFKAWRDSAAVADHRHDRCQRRVAHGLPPPTAHAIAGNAFAGAGRVSESREDKGEPLTCLAAKWLDIFPQNVLYTESHLQVGCFSREKSEHLPLSLTHRKSDSYATPAAERRSAGAG